MGRIIGWAQKDEAASWPSPVACYPSSHMIFNGGAVPLRMLLDELISHPMTQKTRKEPDGRSAVHRPSAPHEFRQ